MKIHNLILFFFTILFFQGCQEGETPEKEPATTPKLGEINLIVTGDENAVPHFEEGLLLLHSFEYQDAREAFLKAQEVDPDFAMAIWGEAMTYNHGLWREQDYDKGQAALKKLDSLNYREIKNNISPVEQDLIASLRVLYGQGTKYERDQAYSSHLKKLYDKYPDNQEIAAFYALSVLGAVPVGRDEEKYEQSAVIAKGILKENPNHPGALHYLIHSYDDPKHAVKAITAANSYSKVAPDAAHALHMPSHIYVAMGMWDEVISSNIASYEASVKRMERKELNDNARSYHALHWLMYGWCQKENWEEAHNTMAEMEKYANSEASARSRAYFVRMRGNYLVETEQWDSPVTDLELDMEGINISLAAANKFTDGLIAYHQEDPAKIERLIEELDKKIQESSLLVTDEGIPMCNAGGSSRSLPNQQDIDQAQIFSHQLRALLAMSQKDTEVSEQWLKEAVALENAISYSYGPPTIFKPTNEMYADWLLEQKRFAEALVQYEYTLVRNPKRRKALIGALEAAKASGSDPVKYSKALEEIRKERKESLS